VETGEERGEVEPVVETANRAREMVRVAVEVWVAERAEVVKGAAATEEVATEEVATGEVGRAEGLVGAACRASQEGTVAEREAVQCQAVEMEAVARAAARAAAATEVGLGWKAGKAAGKGQD
jgi:hypothetical protein